MKKKVTPIDSLGILTRVSSKGQENDGTSIEYQIRKGNEISKRIGMKPISYNEGGVSSWNSNVNTRPILVKMLTDIEGKRCNNIWVWNLDRLGRHSESWYTILKILIGWKVNVYVGESTKPYNFSNSVDKLVIGVLSLISTYDNELRRTRMIFGKKETLKKGRTFIGGEIPFGYDKDESKNLQPNKEQQKYLKKMFKMYGDGGSTTEIQQMMNTSEFEPKRSKIGWNLGTIQKMLQNTIYIGEQEWVWKEKEPDGSITIVEKITIKTPKLVSKKMFDRVQDRFNKYNIRNQYNTDLKSLLKGYLVCNNCGLPMNHRMKTREINNYYYCVYTERNWKSIDRSQMDRYKHSGNTCGMRSLVIDDTDDLVWDTFLKTFSQSVWIKEEFKTKGLSPKDKQEEEVKTEIQKRRRILVGLRKQLNTIDESMVDVELKNIEGGYKSTRIYEGLVKKLEGSSTDLEKQISTLELEIKNLQNSNQWINWVQQMKDELQEMKEWSYEEKEEIIKKFIKQIRVTYEEDTKQHGLELLYNLPIVGDKLEYKDGKNKKLGYDIIKGVTKLVIKHKNKSFKTDENKVELMTTMINLNNQGLSFSEMSSYLNDNNITTRRGGKWYRQSVRRYFNYLTNNVDYDIEVGETLTNNGKKK